MASDLDLAKRQLAVLSRRIAEVRVWGPVPEDWMAAHALLSTQIEVQERLIRELECGYKPISA